jgi:hypothetical protein
MDLRRVALPALAIAAVACSSLRPVRDPMRYISEHNPPIVSVGYVVGNVGFTRQMMNPKVVGDSVTGTWLEGNRPAAVPVRDVHSVSSIRPDGAKTVLFIASVATATGILAYSLFNGAAGQNDWYCDYSPNRRGPAGEPYCGPTEPGRH